MLIKVRAVDFNYGKGEDIYINTDKILYLHGGLNKIVCAGEEIKVRPEDMKAILANMVTVDDNRVYILSAEEAKRRSGLQVNSSAISELRKITALIDTAISEGRYEVCVDGNVLPATKKRLIDAGYKVEENHRSFEPGIIISW